MENSRIEKAYSLQVYQLIKYGTFILTSLFLAKSNIGLNAIGQYELFILVAGSFSFLGSFLLLTTFTSSSFEKNHVPNRIIVFNLFIALLLAALLLAAICCLLNNPIEAYLLNNTPLPMPLILCGYILFSTLAMMIEYIYLINCRSKSILVYETIYFVLQILAVALPLYLGLGLNEIFLGLLSVSSIQFIWLLFLLGKYAKVVFDWPLVIGFFKVRPTDQLSSFLKASVIFIDGFIVISMFSPDDLAIFKFGAHELPLIFLVINSLHLFMLPRFAQAKIDSPLAELRSETSRLNWSLFPMTIVLLLTSHWFYPLVFNAQFESSATIFNIYLLLIISRLLFPQTILTAKRFNKTLVYASLFEIMVNVSASLFLAQKFGIVGVAYGTFIAYLFEKIYLAIACKRLLNIDLVKYVPTRLYFLFSSVIAVIFVLVEFIRF